MNRSLVTWPGFVEQAIELSVGMDSRVARYRYADHFVVVGRGYNYATAYEVALKMTETSYLVVEPYSQADLLHGPMAMIDRGFPALLVAPSGRVLSDLAEVAVRLEGRGAELIAISDDPGILAFWFGEPDEVTPDFIRQAGIDSLIAGETFYVQNLGLPELRDALAAPHLPQRLEEAHECALHAEGARGLLLGGAGDGRDCRASRVLALHKIISGKSPF